MNAYIIFMFSKVLCNPDFYLGEWVSSRNGNIPTGSIQGGATIDGEPLYIGRAEHERTMTIGKIHPSHRCLYIPYDGKEHAYNSYEVLACKTVPLYSEDD